MHRLLLVEDDHDIRVALRQVLEEEGHSVFSAPDGLAALSALKTTDALPCVIILDLEMPILDGNAFLKLRGNEPTLAAIPVIVVSSLPAVAPLLGVHCHLRKPYDLDGFLKSVAEACSEKH